MSTADLGEIGDLLVDTNLLLLFVVGLIAREQIVTFKRTNAYTGADFDLLSTLIRRARRLVVTPHVTTEVSNLAGQLRPDLRRAAFEVLARIAPTFDERAAATAAVVVEPLFLRLGLTDAAITQVARGTVTVLTDDLDLYLALSRAGARVFNFTHVRQGAWGRA